MKGETRMASLSYLRNKAIRYQWTLGIIVIFLIFFFLRLYRLGYHDFWYDEIGTVGYAQYPWANWNAPLYWIMLHFWAKLFGISEFSLRFPSLVFSFLSVVLVFLLGRELFSKKVGIFASLLIGLSPFHLWYAQEARDYSMVLFFGTLSSYLLLKAIRGEGIKLWLFFILVSLIGLYTNYFYIFLFLAQGLYFLLFRKAKISFKEVAYFSIIALGFSLYLPRFLRKFYFVWQGFWIPEPGWRSLLITIENFNLGYNGLPFLYLTSSIIVGIFFIFALRRISEKYLRQPLVFCLSLFLIPVICAFLFSKIFFSVYLDRGLIIFSPYYYLILSLGVVSVNKKARLILALLFFSTVLTANYCYFKNWMAMPSRSPGVHLKKPIRPVVEFIEDNLKAGDKVVFTNQSIMPSFCFYSRRERFFPLLFVPGKAFCPFSRRPIYEGGGISVYGLSNFDFNRLWVISCNWPRDGNLDENSQAVRDFLDKNLKLEFVKEFDGLWIFRYES